jgi:ACS family sodium-dependent inorganic phosphate cotransporter
MQQGGASLTHTLVDPSDHQFADDGQTLWSRKRNVLVVLLCLAIMVLYGLRVILSVAIISISNQYGYDSKAQGLINAGFFIGYLPLQIVGGYLATRYGGKAVMLTAVLVPSLVTAVTPPFASNLYVLVLLRILTGLFEAVSYPCVHALASKWCPALERSKFVGIAWSGAFMGTACTLPLTGALIEAFDWPSSFFVLGGMGLAWSCAWYVLSASSPETHPSISERECAFIVSTRCANTAGTSSFNVEHAVPWRRLLTHSAVWAIVAAHTCHNYLFYMILTWLPSYLNQELHFDVEKSGAVALLPYLACFACSIGAGTLADRLIKRGWTTLTVRKMMMVIAELIPALALGCVGFIHDKVPLVVVLLTAAVGFSGFASGGYASSHLDICPEYAGILLGITNTAATVPGIVAPILVGNLVCACACVFATACLCIRS